MIADVGLIGFPNVGKSTFLSRVTNANPKIVKLSFYNIESEFRCCMILKMAEIGFVIADIPGLIEGASQGSWDWGYEFFTSH